MYTLGIDLGTTYTAAAVCRDARTEVVSLGSRVAAVPSVVLVREDQTVLTGESANRRAVLEPQRVAREFKRRLGDSTPILLGGSPYSAEALTARLLRATVEDVVAREGSRPSALCISHPANWGPFKTDLLLQAVRLAGLDDPDAAACPVTLVTEPEAAAAHYAQQQRIAPGSLVAVYDLGGGTFDAAVLRKTEAGFVILGHPEGIERLGGIDLDAAVFGHVVAMVGAPLTDLDEDDPTAVAAVARLREECTQAKEALSCDTDVTIPVLLPAVSTEVRLTRGELESMIRPALSDSVASLERALANAGVEPAELHSVLLVGGSSRIPLVAQLVGELGRPVTVDTHPKNAVALGAAWLAGAGLAGRTAPGTPVLAVPASPVPRVPAPPVPRVAPVPPVPPPVLRPVGSPVVAPLASPLFGPGSGSLPTERLPVTVGFAGPGPGNADRIPPELVARAPAQPPGQTRRGPVLSRSIFGGIGALILVAGGVTVAATYTGRDNPPAGAGAGSATPSTADPLAGVPADERCTDRIKANPRWVCLTSATFDGLNLTIRYQAEFAGSDPNTRRGYHLHVYGSDGTAKAEQMGQQAADPGHWYVTAENPSVKRASSQSFATVIGDSPKVCARIANGDHGLVTDEQGRYETGNCVRILRGGSTPAPSRRPTTRPTVPPQRPTGTATTATTGTATTDTATLPAPTGTSVTDPVVTDPVAANAGAVNARAVNARAVSAGAAVPPT